MGILRDGPLARAVTRWSRLQQQFAVLGLQGIAVAGLLYWGAPLLDGNPHGSLSALVAVVLAALLGVSAATRFALDVVPLMLGWQSGRSVSGQGAEGQAAATRGAGPGPVQQEPTAGPSPANPFQSVDWSAGVKPLGRSESGRNSGQDGRSRSGRKQAASKTCDQCANSVAVPLRFCPRCGGRSFH